MRRACLALTLLIFACPSPDAPGDASASAPPVDNIKLPAVDAKAATDVEAALESVDPDMRATLAAALLAELERDRLPSSFLAGLKAMTQAAPDMRAPLLAKALSENMVMLDHLCAGEGNTMMMRLADVAREQVNVIIYDTCGLGARGYVERSQLPSIDGMLMLMGHLIDDHLRRGGELHAGERAAIAAMATAPADVPEG